ncbi:MAG: ABC transporter permease [Vicinamibacterales bacterium]|jgi:predicted permease|nr:hypothetical protein [Acidobacteriota bacterium]MDP6372108.1 ABC transporter permease [Vicinamibacterales bacterium]MDP6609254.1 ABC transporter permease [Vicinamibacterales bacterium]HAK57328.1 hypothetical protein [Acidobacteriota bacterium]
MNNLFSDLRFAVRSALRQPVFTLTVVGTLALGIGANTAMFAVIHAALLRPMPYADPDRLVLARTTFDGNPNRWSSLPDYYDYREQAENFEYLVATRSGAWGVPVSGRERPALVETFQVGADLFDLLGVQPIAGRGFTTEEATAGGPYAAVVGEGYAQRRFGGVAAALGQALTITGMSGDGPVAATVVGVMPGSFRFRDEADIWVPVRRGENDGPHTRRFHSWELYGRLKPGVSIESARREVALIAGRLQEQYPDTNDNKALRLDPLQAGLLEAQTPWLMVLMAAVGLVLLIACANVAGLLLARGAARRSELAVRTALGASRSRLVAQLLTESLMLAVAAGLTGTVLAIWLQRLLPAATGLSDAGVETAALSVPVLGFALAVSIATGLVFGVVPALRAASGSPADDLAAGTRTTEGRGGARFRGALVVGQVAISLTLLVCAGLLVRSFARLAATDLGFETEQLLTGNLQLLETEYPEAAQQTQAFAALRDEIAALPGVTAVGFTSHLPIRHPFGNPPAWADGEDPRETGSTANRRVVLPGYFEAMRMPLLAGRDLARTDRADTLFVAVVNETLAQRFFPDQDPIGQRIVIDQNPAVTYEVVGLVADARIDLVSREVRAAAYTSFYQVPGTVMRFAVRATVPPEQLAETVRRAVTERNPNVFISDVEAMERIVGDSLVSERVTALTLAMFSGVALLLAALGLYGVLAYYVAQRTREIGVRVAMGAEPRAIVAYVLKRSSRMVVPGLALGVVASLVGGRLIEHLLYEVPATDPVTLLTVSGSLAAVALVASVWPAWRASRIDPVQALRSE